MTKEEREKAIKSLKEWRDYFESLDLDSESPEDDPTNEADSLEAFKLGIEALSEESKIDKIVAEIKKLKCFSFTMGNGKVEKTPLINKDVVLDIINKYREVE